MNKANIDRNKANHVAQFAIAGKPDRKAHAKLQSRVEDHTAMLRAGSKENKVDTRMQTGGYHRPGSMQRAA